LVTVIGVATPAVITVEVAVKSHIVQVAGAVQLIVFNVMDWLFQLLQPLAKVGAQYVCAIEFIDVNKSTINVISLKEVYIFFIELLFYRIKIQYFKISNLNGRIRKSHNIVIFRK
jgi:hypothetical protein